MWIINQDKTKEYWLEVYNEENLYRAVCKWDGCVHFNHYNVNKDFDEDNAESDYLHICSLSDFIQELTELRDTAKSFFGKDWDEVCGH